MIFPACRDRTWLQICFCDEPQNTWKFYFFNTTLWELTKQIITLNKLLLNNNTVAALSLFFECKHKKDFFHKCPVCMRFNVFETKCFIVCYYVLFWIGWPTHSFYLSSCESFQAFSFVPFRNVMCLLASYLREIAQGLNDTQQKERVFNYFHPFDVGNLTLTHSCTQ